MDESNDRESGQEPSLVATLIRLARGSGRGVARTLKKAPVAFAVVVVVSFSTGTLSGNFFNPAADPATPAAPPNPAPPAATGEIANNVDFVTGATIDKILDSTEGKKTMTISFSAKGLNERQVRNLVGQEKLGCREQGHCTATVKNVDQGDKDYSGAIHEDCLALEGTGTTVTIAFSGKRNYKKSDYVNVWAVREDPSQQG